MSKQDSRQGNSNIPGANQVSRGPQVAPAADPKGYTRPDSIGKNLPTVSQVRRGFPEVGGSSENKSSTGSGATADAALQQYPNYVDIPVPPVSNPGANRQNFGIAP